MADEIVFELITLRGVIVSASSMFIRSWAVRRSLRKPLRSSSPANSAIVRMRRLPRWSMSSISPLPPRRLTR